MNCITSTVIKLKAIQSFQFLYPISKVKLSTYNPARERKPLIGTEVKEKSNYKLATGATHELCHPIWEGGLKMGDDNDSTFIRREGQ